MVGTKDGGTKAAKTTKNRHGEDFYARIGRKGGQNGHTGGFYARPELAKTAGKKGGKISSRAGVKNGEGKTKKKSTSIKRTRTATQAPKKTSIFKKIFGGK